MQSICEEATYLTIAHDYESGAELIKKIDAIIEKYRPVFISEKAPGYNTSLYPVIRWYFEIGSEFGGSEDIMAVAPYGGTNIYYPLYESDAIARIHGSAGTSAKTSQFLPVCNMEVPVNPSRAQTTRKCLEGNGLPNGRVFVLTVVCNYPFSNSMVKYLFGKGVNTKIANRPGGSLPASAENCARGNMYLLWARGAGIVNPK